MKEHLGHTDGNGVRKNNTWSSIKMLLNDVLPISDTDAAQWTEQALEVYGLMTNDSKIIKSLTRDGTIHLNLYGNSKENVEKITKALSDKGYNNVKTYTNY
jgi:hypothetical protein